MARNPPWHRDELILALDLYLRMGLLDDKHPQVQELSSVLNRLAVHPSRPDPGRFRNPNGAAMKLANFAALDPSYAGTALSRGGRLDRKVWGEFAGDRGRLGREAAALRGSVGAARAPEVEDARDLVAECAGRPRSGQGFRVSAAVRQAVEQHAMCRAVAHYEAEGWSVEDVSRRESYDLRCVRSEGQELRVEVKGTAGDGSEILLTPNEVEHARAFYPNVELFIVANVYVADPAADSPEVSGGDVVLLSPWRIEDGCLTPVGFSYSVSADPASA